MEQVNIPFPEVATICLLDVLSMALLCWLVCAVIGLVRRCDGTWFAVALALSAAVTLDGITFDGTAWKRAWIAVAGVPALALAGLPTWRTVRRRKGLPGEAVGVAVLITGLAVLLIVVVGVVYALWRERTVAVGFFSRLAFGMVVVLAAFPVLMCGWVTHRRRAISFAVLAGCAAAGMVQAVRWRNAWTGSTSADVSLTRPSVAPGRTFPRLRALLEVRRALAAASKDRPAAVDHLRRAAAIVDPEWWQRRLHAWTDQPVEFALTLAFGGSVRMGQGEQAVGFLLDDEGSRFLVLTDRGRIVSTRREDSGLPSVKFPPVAFDFAQRTLWVFLGRGGELVMIPVSSGEPIRRRLPPPREYRALAHAGGSLFFLRSQGSVVRLHGGALEEHLAAIWARQKVAIDMAVTEDGEGCYVLDAHGGVHPRGQTAIHYSDLREHDETPHYWRSGVMGTAIRLTGDGFPVYGDRYGGVHGVRKADGGLVYAGHERPRFDRPEAVDLLLTEPYSAVYILTKSGKILVVPEYGWLRGSNSKTGS